MGMGRKEKSIPGRQNHILKEGECVQGTKETCVAGIRRSRAWNVTTYKGIKSTHYIP